MAKPLELFSTNEAATFLRVTPRALELMRHEGRGPRYLKLGRRVYYEPEALRVWARAQERRPQPRRAA